MVLRIGLTGGAASGKSTVSALFAQFGVPIIDADEINRGLLDKNSNLFPQIIDLFGTTILTKEGDIDRGALRQRIFSSPVARKQLEAILHPVIRQQMLTDAEHCDYPYCILVIPLLFEVKMQSLLDRILVVDASEATQQQRLIARDGISENLAIAMLKNQCLRQQRLQLADDIIDNSGQESMLYNQVAELHQSYLKMARNVIDLPDNAQ